MSKRVGMRARTGAGTGEGTGTITEMRVEGRESGSSQSGDRGGSEDARRGAAPKSNRQPQSQDPTSHRDPYIMLS